MSPSAIEPPGTAPGHLDARYLESLFQGAGFGIIACRPDGEIVAANTAAARLFGRRTLSGPVGALFSETDRAAVEQMFENVQTTRETGELQLRLGGTEEEPVEYAVWFTPVVDLDDSLQGVSLWFRDITQRMSLQRQVDKRVRLESLGSLSGAVAHHYNNLLGGIATSVEYAINMNTTTAMRRSLQRTADAVSRATHITQQLLAFAQADHAGGDLADLTEVVLHFLDANEERLVHQHIKLQVDWQVVPVIPVRRDQMWVILNNLFANAIEAMPNGGILSVTLGRRDEHSIVLSITDTGPGIDPKHMEHLFEPFFTTKGELGNGAGRNAGMGLAVAHGLVGEMCGTITGSNVPGRGARFDIVLPVQSKP